MNTIISYLIDCLGYGEADLIGYGEANLYELIIDSEDFIIYLNER